MEIYGATGMVHAVDRVTLHLRDSLNAAERAQTLAPRPAPLDDVFAFFCAVLRGDVTLTEDDLSGLKNNLMVMRILDAARESARLGRTVIV